MGQYRSMPLRPLLRRLDHRRRRISGHGIMNQDANTQAGDIFEMFFETAEDYCCVLEPPVESDMYPGNYRIIRANRSFKNFAALHGLPVGAAKSFFDDPWWSDLLSRVLKESAAFTRAFSLQRPLGQRSTPSRSGV